MCERERVDQHTRTSVVVVVAVSVDVVVSTSVCVTAGPVVVYGTVLVTLEGVSVTVVILHTSIRVFIR